MANGCARSFQREQPVFPFLPEGESAQAPACDDPVARHREQEPVGRAGAPHGPGGSGMADLRGEFRVGDGLPAGNPADCLPHALAEGGGFWKMQRQRGEFALEMAERGGGQMCRGPLGKFHGGEPVARVGALDFHGITAPGGKSKRARKSERR